MTKTVHETQHFCLGFFTDHLILVNSISESSILGPLLFPKCINDLSQLIKNSKIHHFADDTNLYASCSLNDINKKINFDLSNLVQWLRENKSLN